MSEDTAVEEQEQEQEVAAPEKASSVSVEDLLKIQGLGQKKAEAIAAVLSGDTTVEDLQSLRGVSETLAKQVVTLRDTGKVPQAKRRARKQTAKKTASKAPATKANGRINLTAGALRKMARAMEQSDPDEARRIQRTVADLLDNESVPQDRFA